MSTVRWPRTYGGPHRPPLNVPWGPSGETWARPDPPGGYEGLRIGEASHPGPPRGRKGNYGASPAVPRGSRRWDFPEVHPYSRGSLPDLGTPELRGAHLRSFQYATYARSTRPSRDSLWKTLTFITNAWGLGDPLPLTVEKVLAIGATLLAGKYRSFKNYFSRVHTEAERSNSIPHPVAVSRAIKDAQRACSGGMGGPRKREGLPLERLPSLPPDPAPWVPGGPVWPRDTLLLGAWWLLRELELAFAQAQHLTFSCGAGGLVDVTWLLPASKTDPRAIGVTRTHGCSCGACRFGDEDTDVQSEAGEPLSVSLCPVRTAARHVMHVVDLCERLGGGGIGWIPAIPQPRGGGDLKRSSGRHH